MLTSFARHDTIPEYDVCVVGAGPVIIALALACERHGMSVLVLESGRSSRIGLRRRSPRDMSSTGDTMRPPTSRCAVGSAEPHAGAAGGAFRSTMHGVFGSGITQALASMNAQQRARIKALAESHGIDFLKSPADMLLRFAFSNNPDGVVIISMFDTKHIERNIAASRLPPIPGFAAAVRDILA